MNFDFLDESALVEKKKKYANFTIREIGGPDDIKKWREMQAAKESIYRMRLGERDERLKDLNLATPEIKTRTWDEKQAFAASERHRLSQAELDVILYPPWEVSEPVKKTLFQRVVSFIKGLWINAEF